ncbi:hypothetical protein KO527_07210 [Pseudoalteromonas sp. C2R02]|uniref:hypothetical protein n=1 Tax=Pseudoalteromonas sp. C2R02 TaxID=2841565 RepID=UPI001C0A5BC0|nr:hypothetical protein [Pseudoalteromonas sp. C2R02]MBU2969130.1 hypothetical protein [Pseudoalteromonas sp. C2R02]
MKKLLIGTAVVAAIAGGIGYANHSLMLDAKAELDKQLAMINSESGVKIDYQDVSVNVLEKSFLIEQIKLAAPDGSHFADVKSVKVIGYDPQKITDYAEFNLKELVISDSVKQQLPPGVADEFINSKINLLSSMKYDESNNHADFKNEIQSSGVAGFKFDLSLANVKELFDLSVKMNEQHRAQVVSGKEQTLEQQFQQQTQLMNVIQGVKPETVSFEIANLGKLELALTQLASAQQMELVQLQEMIKQQLSFSPAPQVLKEGLTTFIDNLGSLNISIAVPDNMSVADFQKPETLQKLASPEEMAKFFNLTVAAK